MALTYKIVNRNPDNIKDSIILCIIDGDQDFFLTLRNHISSFVEDAWNEACAKDRKKHNGVLELEHTDYWSIYKNDIDQLEKSLIKDK